MCDPVTQTIIAVAQLGMGYMNDKAEANARTQQQKRQNEMARRNAVQKMASEELRIRQEFKATRGEMAEQGLKSKRARATAEVQAGEGGVSGRSVDALFAEYYREEGLYKNAQLNNLAGELVQHRENMKAISLGQEANSTYVTKFSPMTSLANRGLQFAGTYADIRIEQERRSREESRGT